MCLRLQMYRKDLQGPDTYIGVSYTAVPDAEPSPLTQYALAAAQMCFQSPVDLQLKCHAPPLENETVVFNSFCRCRQWVDESAVLFHASFADNVFHFINDAYLSVFHTIVDSGLAPPHVLR